MRYLLLFFLVALAGLAQARPPQIFLDVARFRNLNLVEKGAEVDIYITVPTQSLSFRQRAPKQFQSAATVTLEVLKADGKPAYREVITLKPPVINDTTMEIKNPQSFLKRVLLPDGKYTLRGTVRDQYRTANGETIVEQPLVLEAPAGVFMSDIVLLSKPAARNGGSDNFSRGGYSLSRTPIGFYGRGANNLFFYTEVHQATPSQALTMRYTLTGPNNFSTTLETTIAAAAGKPTPVIGQLPLGALPDGEYTLLIEAYSGKKLLAGQRIQGQRKQLEYVPAGASAR
jgi:hypothetical protein